MSSNISLTTACLGVIAGMRSMAAPALVSDHLARTRPEALADSPLRWMGTAKAATITKFLAAGEVVGDKLPMTPARIAPGPLFGRIVSGGLCGATLYAAEGKQARTGAVIGALAAAGGAYACYYLRRSAGANSKVPDPVFGAIEDVLAFGTGWRILRTR